MNKSNIIISAQYRGRVCAPVSWITQVDNILLEWLDEHGIAAPPKVVYVNLETAVSYSQVNRRLRKLEQNGLVEHDPDRNDYYAITEKGRTYLHDPDATAEDFPDTSSEE